MKTCKACGDSYRKGQLAHVVVDGKLVQARVCLRCSVKAFHVCLTSAAPRCACGEKAASCSKCVEKAEKRGAQKASDLKKHIRHLKGLLKAYSVSGSSLDGERCLGLQQAVDYLESAEALTR